MLWVLTQPTQLLWALANTLLKFPMYPSLVSISKVLRNITEHLIIFRGQTINNHDYIILNWKQLITWWIITHMIISISHSLVCNKRCVVSINVLRFVWEMALSIRRSLNNNGNHNKRNIYFISILLVMYYIYSNHTLLIMNYICYHVMWRIMTAMYINYIKSCLIKKKYKFWESGGRNCQNIDNDYIDCSLHHKYCLQVKWRMTMWSPGMSHPATSVLWQTHGYSWERRFW